VPKISPPKRQEKPENHSSGKKAGRQAKMAIPQTKGKQNPQVPRIALEKLKILN